MCGLAINIASFTHLLKKVDFDAIVDHLALTHIMRSKVEPATTRIKTVAQYNHQSLQAELGIKTLSSILTKHLTEQG